MAEKKRKVATVNEDFEALFADSTEKHDGARAGNIAGPDIGDDVENWETVTAESQEEPVTVKSTEDLVNELRAARANVRALCVLLGMAAEKYPATLTPQFIRECVDLKQMDELKAKEDRGVAHIAGAVGPELFARLVELYEAAVADDP